MATFIRMYLIADVISSDKSSPQLVTMCDLEAFLDQSGVIVGSTVDVQINNRQLCHCSVQNHKHQASTSSRVIVKLNSGVSVASGMKRRIGIRIPIDKRSFRRKI